MRRILFAAAAAAVLVINPIAANARTYYFDCGGQKIPKVILSGQYVRVGVYRVNSIATFEVTIGGVDAFAKITRTPVFRWDQLTDKATLDDRHCRLLTNAEVENLTDPQFGDDHDGDK